MKRLVTRGYCILVNDTLTRIDEPNAGNKQRSPIICRCFGNKVFNKAYLFSLVFRQVEIETANDIITQEVLIDSFSTKEPRSEDIQYISVFTSIRSYS